MEYVHVLCIDHRHGTDLSVHRTVEHARETLLAYVRESWEGDGPEESMPSTPDEAISAYFDQEWIDEPESYRIERLPILG